MRRPFPITRRRLLVSGAALLLGTRTARATPARRTAFADLPDGDGWGPGWACPGAANLRVAGGTGVLEAATDVFPTDPRPVCFAIDARFRDGSVRATLAATGSACGVVARRTSPRDYYAAILDAESAALQLVRRTGTDLVVLAQTPALAVGADPVLELTVTGAAPTTLRASLTGGFAVQATDAEPALQGPGDPGVLGQARTLFPSAGPPAVPALGNLHLLPYGVQEGQAVIASPVGQALVDAIRRQSTAAFRDVTVTTTDPRGRTPAAVLAATTGAPRPGGARLHVAADLPAHVVIETADTPAFHRPRRVAAGPTDAFDAFTTEITDLPPGRAYWRATLRRAGTTSRGPVRSFPVLPAAGDPAPTRIAIAACASQFGPLFDDLAAMQPDVFVWQGDLNYPDTVGPLAQTTAGYAGIWRDFLANPRLAPVLERSAFAAIRDDHDYAAQDSNSTTIPDCPWGVHPWDALLGADLGYRFSAGLADVWVLDQRRFKTDPAAPDTPAKTLLGDRQREWLVHGLRTSTAPFKVICSPCTVFMRANARDGNWASGFTGERDALLAHIDAHVGGRVVFVTGDTHLTGVYDAEDRYEVRACPLGIPVPNDITLSDPQSGDKLRATPGVAYADERCHYAVLEIGGDERTATLDITLRREDGTAPYTQRFTEPRAPRLRVGIERRPLRVRIALDRPGLVRLRARLAGRVRHRTVRFRRAGVRRIRLRLPRPRGRLTVTARYRPPSGATVVRRIRRRLGR